MGGGGGGNAPAEAKRNEQIKEGMKKEQKTRSEE